MRRPLRPITLLHLLLLTACSGGSDPVGSTPTPPTPPVSPPPVTPPTPASLTVQSGDGQSGEPSVALSVPLAVVVRDAGGRALPGVAVTFAVDSGGGSIGSATATSGTDGTASAGIWTLGPATGRQVVSARVGTLPPARFVATAEWASVELPEQTVASSGGVLRVARPGRALDGVELTVPAAAVNTGVSLRVSITATAPTGLPQGSTVISASPVTLREPLLLRVPFDPAVGIAPGDASRVVWMRERDGAWRALPRVRTTATYVDVLLPTLGASTTAPNVAASTTAQPQTDGATVIDIVQGLLRVTRDVDAGYRPGTDDWDFARQSVFGPAGAVVDPGPGMISASLWYFRSCAASPRAIAVAFGGRRSRGCACSSGIPRRRSWARCRPTRPSRHRLGRRSIGSRTSSARSSAAISPRARRRNRIAPPSCICSRAPAPTPPSSASPIA
ncbi:MAG: Ig-like domain-containing protein [Gemmatimonadaceae bacterium]|nr:Ig-like domain-containing protein [Gemmatimonadaceae bacterium]